MGKLQLTKTLLIVSLFMGLTACGNANEFELLDDPTQEQFVETPPTADQDLPDAQHAPDEQAETPTSIGEKSAILEKYDHVDPTHLIQDKHLEAALLYFDKNKAKIKNQNYISVIDFSKSSKQKRFFVVNLKTGFVWALHTSHGSGSDSNHDSYAEKFSNKSGSNASSLGVYVTAETYYGKYDLSLRLDGKSTTNSNARARAVVIHGAPYVQDANVRQGRSWGCPAIALEHRTELINKIKNGSVIYAGI